MQRQRNWPIRPQLAVRHRAAVRFVEFVQQFLQAPPLGPLSSAGFALLVLLATRHAWIMRNLLGDVGTDTRRGQVTALAALAITVVCGLRIARVLSRRTYFSLAAAAALITLAMTVWVYLDPVGDHVASAPRAGRFRTIEAGPGLRMALTAAAALVASMLVQILPQLPRRPFTIRADADQTPRRGPALTAALALFAVVGALLPWAAGIRDSSRYSSPGVEYVAGWIVLVALFEVLLIALARSLGKIPERWYFGLSLPFAVVAFSTALWFHQHELTSTFGCGSPCTIAYGQTGLTVTLAATGALVVSLLWQTITGTAGHERVGTLGPAVWRTLDSVSSRLAGHDNERRSSEPLHRPGFNRYVVFVDGLLEDPPIGPLISAGLALLVIVGVTATWTVRFAGGTDSGLRYDRGLVSLVAAIAAVGVCWLRIVGALPRKRFHILAIGLGTVAFAVPMLIYLIVVGDRDPATLVEANRNYINPFARIGAGPGLSMTSFAAGAFLVATLAQAICTFRRESPRDIARHRAARAPSVVGAFAVFAIVGITFPWVQGFRWSSTGIEYTRGLVALTLAFELALVCVVRSFRLIPKGWYLGVAALLSIGLLCVQVSMFADVIGRADPAFDHLLIDCYSVCGYTSPAPGLYISLASTVGCLASLSVEFIGGGYLREASRRTRRASLAPG